MPPEHNLNQKLYLTQILMHTFSYQRWCPCDKRHEVWIHQSLALKWQTSRPIILLHNNITRWKLIHSTLSQSELILFSVFQEEKSYNTQNQIWGLIHNNFPVTSSNKNNFGVLISCLSTYKFHDSQVSCFQFMVAIYGDEVLINRRRVSINFQLFLEPFIYRHKLQI